MIRQRNSRLWLKLNGLVRSVLMRCRPVQIRGLLVNEYPKSGGTWLASMLSDLLDIPFARNRLPYAFPRQLLHGHYLPSTGSRRMRGVIVWRDGRDVMVSLYYHCLFYNDRSNKVLVDYTRSHLQFRNFQDIATNLPDFIEFIGSGRGVPRFHWGDFVSCWSIDPTVAHVKYEALFDNCSDVLLELVKELGYSPLRSKAASVCSRHSLGRARQRHKRTILGGEDPIVPFVREGGYGGWRKVFTLNAAQTFDFFMGNQLIELGYEGDRSWVSRCPTEVAERWHPCM